eukprot:7391577-Prymnesium_polylepis.1
MEDCKAVRLCLWAQARAPGSARVIRVRCPHTLLTCRCSTGDATGGVKRPRRGQVRASSQCIRGFATHSRIRASSRKFATGLRKFVTDLRKFPA